MRIVFAVILGICFGSFANVLIYRLPRKLSVVFPASHCPECSHPLKFFDLIPILSFLIQHGRCRYCKAKIDLRYPVVELLCGILFVVMPSPPLAFLAVILLAISFIDWDTKEIPDSLIIAGILVGVIANIHIWQNALLGLIAGGLPLFLLDKISLLIFKKDGFGYGDVKLMAMAGIYVGKELILTAHFFALIIGGAFAVFLLATGRAERGQYMAFGPFLAMGIIMSILYRTFLG